MGSPDRMHAGSPAPAGSKAAAVLGGQVALTVALAGQPNVGKSTVFNLLTGLSQHTGHWPEGGLEQKTGTCRYEGAVLRVVDLPSVHSLTANSLDERTARDYIIGGRPDVVVVVADAAALETSLYLLAELLWLPVPVVLGLNMLDSAGRQGLHLEPHVLEAALGLPVVPMAAARNQGVRELAQAVQRVACREAAYAPNRPEINPDHRPVLAEIVRLIAGQVPPPYPEEWVALAAGGRRRDHAHDAGPPGRPSRSMPCCGSTKTPYPCAVAGGRTPDRPDGAGGGDPPASRPGDLTDG